MGKQYFTKTGNELKLIQGLKGSDIDDYSLRLDTQFLDSSIFVNTQSYIGGPDQFQLIVDIVVADTHWPKTKQKRHEFLGKLTVSCGNYLHRFFGLNSYVIPMVNSDQRAAKGLKAISYRYNISKTYAESLGIDPSQWRAYGSIKTRGQSMLVRLANKA